MDCRVTASGGKCTHSRHYCSFCDVDCVSPLGAIEHLCFETEHGSRVGKVLQLRKQYVAQAHSVSEKDCYPTPIEWINTSRGVQVMSGMLLYTQFLLNKHTKHGKCEPHKLAAHRVWRNSVPMRERETEIERQWWASQQTSTTTTSSSSSLSSSSSTTTRTLATSSTLPMSVGGVVTASAGV